MRRHHHTPPTGIPHDRVDDVGDDFWGGTADWPTRDVPVVAHEPALDRGGADRRAEPSDGDPVDPGSGPGHDHELLDDERWDADWTAEPRRPAGIDPFVLRVAAIIVALTLAVPLLLGLRSDGDDPCCYSSEGCVPMEATE
jgi:hypothetical protein